jgi:hypothetical protein
MIYELRIYTLRPGALPEYLRLQKEVGRAIRGDDYGKFEGAWSSEFGTLNQYVHLWSYADAGERQRLRVELAKNEAWSKEFIARTAGLVRNQENRILLLVEGVPFTPPDRGGHVYELRSYRAHYQQAPKWVGHFKAVLPARQEYSRLVGLWTGDVGPLNQVTHLWAYDDLNQRADVRARVMQDPRWKDYLASSLPLLAEQHAVVLVPTDYSPLK